MSAKDALAWMSMLKASLSLEPYRAYMRGMIASSLSPDPEAEMKRQGSAIEGVISTLAKRLSVAEAYYLTADMLQVVQWAAAGLEDIDRFERDTWPTDDGFLLLQEPLLAKEARGRTMTTKAITWNRHTVRNEQGDTLTGFLVTSYSDLEDPRDEVTPGLREQVGERRFREIQGVGRLQAASVAFVSDGMRVGPSVIDTSNYGPDMFGLPPMPYTENGHRFLLSFLMMLNQTITVTTREQVSKKHAARMAKRNLPSEVTIVQMRRIAGATRAEGESQVEWQHRWLVRGHWRNQPYKGEGGTTEYRRIWIAPFVKGPEDRPLKQSTKVYSLSR